MTQTTSISTKELQRQATLCFVGKTLNVMLCSAGTSGFTKESTVAQWQSVEKTEAGYTRYSGVVASGSYDNSLGLYRIPDIDVEFTPTTSMNYDTVILYFTGETYIHSIISESPAIALYPGQTQTYRISLRQDD